MITNDIEKEVQRIINLFPENQQFIVEVQFAPDYDDDGNYYTPAGNSYCLTTEEAIREIVKNFMECENDTVKFDQNVVSILQNITTQETFFQTFQNFFGEEEYQSSKIQTKENYQEKQRISKRRQLEETAAFFVQKYNLEGIDTFEGMKILHDLINSQNAKREQFFSSESRAERYATYAMSGCRHTFWEDEDYTRNEFDGNLDKLYDLLCYVRDYFPLFWKEYQNHALDEINAEE